MPIREVGSSSTVWVIGERHEDGRLPEVAPAQRLGAVAETRAEAQSDDGEEDGAAPEERDEVEAVTSARIGDRLRASRREAVVGRGGGRGAALAEAVGVGCVGGVGAGRRGSRRGGRPRRGASSVGCSICRHRAFEPPSCRSRCRARTPSIVPMTVPGSVCLAAGACRRARLLGPEPRRRAWPGGSRGS